MILCPQSQHFYQETQRRVHRERVGRRLTTHSQSRQENAVQHHRILFRSCQNPQNH